MPVKSPGKQGSGSHEMELQLVHEAIAETATEGS